MDFDALPTAGDTDGCEATIRAEPSDFQVAEQLPFELQNSGDHVWLYVQKVATNTDWLAQQLARFAGVTSVSVGYAGLKDRHAVTSQWFSINLQGLPEPDWSELENEQFTVLKNVRHHRKLQRGALSGNQFVLRLTEIQGDRQRWQQNLQRIAEYGVPNYFAAQRFGRQGMNLQNVDKWFNGEPAPKKRQQRSMQISAARSWLFNLVLAERINQQNWQQAITGDIMLLSGTRASYFLCETPDQEIADRLQRMDVHPTGPLWGKGDPPNSGQSLQLEQQVLSSWQVWQQQLAKLDLRQERRSLRLFPQQFSWQFEDDQALTIRFNLPAGTYATAVLRELATIHDSHAGRNSDA